MPDIQDNKLNSCSNRLALGKHYLSRDETVSGLPVFLTIETTSLCNLKCVMCPYPTMGRKNEHMNGSLYDRIIDEAAGSVEFIWLHLFGEPLLNPDIYRMIDAAENAGIRVGISSNATALTEKAAHKLLDSQLSLLLLSMDGSTKEAFEQIRVGAKFEAVSANIRRFAEIKRERGGKLIAMLQMIDMHLNATGREAFVREWQNCGLDGVFIKGLHTWGNQDKTPVSLGTPAESIVTSMCYEPWVGMTILADGTAVPCCNDYSGRQPLGDLKVQSLTEIWNGAEMRNLRRMLADDHADRRGTICANCTWPCARVEDARLGLGPFNPMPHFGNQVVDVREMHRLTEADAKLLSLRALASHPVHESGAIVEYAVEIINDSPRSLRTSGSNPINIAYHWYQGERCVIFDGTRSRLAFPVRSGTRAVSPAIVTAPTEPGKYRLVIALVQEAVAWFDDPQRSISLDVEVKNTAASSGSFRLETIPSANQPLPGILIGDAG